METSYLTKNENDTEQLGVELAQKIRWGTVIALHGNLGCGKTVFTRGLARGLGIVEPVSSPTFTIVQEYRLKEKFFYHLDLYRIDNVDAAFAFGIDEFLGQENSIAAVEWPERVTEILDDSVVRVYFEHLEKDQRTIRIAL